MSADFMFTLPEKGSRLLRVIVAEIKSGRIKKREPATFISYSEALQKLGLSPHGRAGQQLQREGLNELNDWTQEHNDLPKIAGLIVGKRGHEPAAGFAKSHGMGDLNWREWWLKETDRAIDFDWSPFIEPSVRVAQQSARINEPVKDQYRGIITISPGQRGGRPCIRGMRITVGDVLGWLAVGMTEAEIIDDFPELTHSDIHAALAFAAKREKRAKSIRHEIAL